jgi:hypothetical protein
MPEVVHALKEIGLAASDAWEIWQQRFEYVDVNKRPQGIAFETYIQEKIHLLKQRQAEGKVKSATGFLLKAIKQNYANPEFAEEEKRRQARDKAKTKHSTERRRQLLEEEKEEIKKARDAELHRLCELMVKDTPALLAEVVEHVFKDNALLRKACQPGKTLLETYQEKPMLWVMVDHYLMQRSPERFVPVRERYDIRLAAIDQRTVGAEQPTT